MSLFIDPPVDPLPPQERINRLATTSLLVAVTGVVTYAGLFVAVGMAHRAMHQLRHNHERGRGLAVASLWIAYVAIVAMPLALCARLLFVYMALPQPVF